MYHLISYTLKDYIQSYRFFPPFVVLLLCIIIQYGSSTSHVMESYAVTLIYMFFVSSWICYTLFGSENTIQKQITLVHCKNNTSLYYASKILSAWLLCMVIGVFVVTYPIIFNTFHEQVTLYALTVALLSHFCIALIAISCTIFFTSTLLNKMSYGIGGILFVAVLSLAQGALFEQFSFYVYVSWIIPPSYTLMDVVMHAGDTSMVKFSITLLLSFIYCVLFIVVYLSVMKRKIL
ncbi:hypothetical protein [Longirhabdus pacifica]|uniref:hypothetical protein n=1 Tax=Longirhabdus pacifica TaxID=2305227 RepID=UPI0010090D68|nr:hypothetical protein [Longirhabdus pacifica]